MIPAVTPENATVWAVEKPHGELAGYATCGLNTGCPGELRSGHYLALLLLSELPHDLLGDVLQDGRH